MEDLEKLIEAVSLLADCIESHNNNINRLLSMYQMLEKKVEKLEESVRLIEIEYNDLVEKVYEPQITGHMFDCLVGSYDRESSINEDRYVTYPCTCKE